MRRLIVLRVLVLVALVPALAGCPSQTAPTPKEEEQMPETKQAELPPPRTYVLDNVGGTALVQLYADGFDKLSLNDKLLAYHLYRAAAAGRDITYDQNHRHALTVRLLLDQILSHPLGLKQETEEKLLAYMKMLWLNNGMYHDRNKSKFVAGFTRDELLDALGVARANGADFSKLGGPLEDIVAEIEPTLFDPLVEPLITNKSPGPGGDILRDSAGNYYLGVTMADLEGVVESFPLNSRLVKECPRKGKCAVVEQVYRTGTKDPKGKWIVQPGLYAAQLEAMIGHMEAAAAYATPGQKRYLERLVAHFRTGDPAEFDQASIAWLEEDPNVDAILGFIESYKDPRSQKAEYEGLVYFKDVETSELMQAIARSAPYFEKNCPWDDKYKKEDVKVPVAAAINVLAGFGGAGPSIPAGINLPNAQWIREKHGSRSVLLTNVMAAARAAVSDSALGEFALPEEVLLTKKYRESVSRSMVALHEVVGHGSGKANPTLTQDPAAYLKETYATLEEARAELVALHHINDPRMIEIKAVQEPEAGKVAYQDYLRSDLLLLRRIKSGTRIEDDHMRATHLIVQWLLRNSKAAEVRKIGSKTYYVLVDFQDARDAVARLLSEIMRIKAEGDLDAARRLVDEYAATFDAALRDEIVARSNAAGVPDFVAFHVPALKLVRDEQGQTVDVVVDYGKDFVTSMLEMDLGGG